MIFSNILGAGALSLASLASAAPAAQKGLWSGPQAVYFQTSSSPVNYIVALPVQQDGTLQQGTWTSTGGEGSVAIFAFDGLPFPREPLTSQDSVVVLDNYLFAVNAGSNTLSMFYIDEQNPLNLTLLGKPVDVKGEFPTTLAVSKKHSVACVASCGAVAGVACGGFSGQGLEPMDQLRDLTFELGQSTPPVGPLDTMGDLLFSADEETLYAVVKGNRTDNQQGGIASYPVVNGVPAIDAVSNKDLNPSAVLFGTIQIPGTTDLLATDATVGSLILSTDGPNVAVKQWTQILGEGATCWAAYSPATGTAFLTDIFVDRLYEIDVDTGDLVRFYNLTTPSIGNQDIRAAKDWLYVLAPGVNTSTYIQVFDASAGRGKAELIQSFIPANITNGKVMGLGVWPTY